MTSAPYEDIDPVDETDEVDRSEQLLPADDDRYDDQVDIDADVEANDADLAEQARAVPDSEDDYPHS